jgi:signal transduction histidine kinase
VTGIAQQDAVGKLATDVYQSESAPYLEEYSRVALTGNPYEFTVYYPPMDKYFMISAVSPQHGQFATITTDITAIKQIQEVVSAKNRELENYLFVASHDLRSPLVNIQGFSQRLQKQTDSITQILSEYPLDSDIQQKIEKITKEGIPKSLDFIFTNVSKMDTLINGLLKISRTGRVKMSIQEIEMNTLIQNVIRALSFQIEEAGADIVVENLPDCYGDAALLDQLFANIIGNALKYRDKERQLVITIDAQTHYNKVLYSVHDTGIGIAQRHLEKIWDVFYQVDSQSPEAGEGIGLSIVKRIIDKHKGKIRVESEEGKGSVFYIELPGYEFSE